MSQTKVELLDLNGLEAVLDADADTTITADTDDQIDFKAGGVDEMTLSSTGLVINESSNDRDVRIESNGNTHMLFVDGGNDCVNIGASSDRGGLLNVEGNGGVVIRVGDNNDALKLQSTDTDANAGPILTLERSNNSAATSDEIGKILFKAQNAANEAIEYCEIRTDINDATDGSEDGRFIIQTIDAGSAGRSRMEILGTETIFNQDSADIDFRIEGNGDANLFKINAGTDQVFINGNAQDLASNGLNVGGDGNDFTMGISNQDTSSGISFMKFTDGSGDQCGLITGDAGNNSLSLSSGSDYRLKENINYNWDATTELKKLKPAQFNMKKNTEKTILNGFIAHEIAEVLPEVVIGKKDETEVFKNVVLNSNGLRIHRGITEEQWKKGKDKGKYAENTTWQASQTLDKMQTVDYAKLTPLLTKALQEAMARIEALEAK